MSTTNETGVSRHPKGLYVLCATEMWERFSFYTMIAMFALSDNKSVLRSLLNARNGDS